MRKRWRIYRSVAGGWFDHSIVTALWELTTTPELVESYQSALTQHGIKPEELKPALRLTSSDVGLSGANLFPTLFKGRDSKILPASFESALKEILELRTKKQAVDKQSKELDEQIKQLYAPIVDKMGTGCEAVCMAPSQTYKLSYSPRYRTGINADDLKKLQAMNRLVYDEYVTTSESRVFAVKKESA